METKSILRNRAFLWLLLVTFSGLAAVSSFAEEDDLMREYGPNNSLYKAADANKGVCTVVDGTEVCQQTKNISETQNTLAKVSQVSDVAAVGAIGAVGYAEMGVKKQGQASTFESAAHIQSMASKVSYAAGATDVAIGAYSMFNTVDKLKKLKTKANDAQQGKIDAAISATKAAGQSHIMYGAGKLAIGYAAGKMAQQASDRAEAMEAMDEAKFLEKQMAAQANRPPGSSVSFSQNLVTGGTATPLAQSAANGASGYGNNALPYGNSGGSTLKNFGAGGSPLGKNDPKNGSPASAAPAGGGGGSGTGASLPGGGSGDAVAGKDAKGEALGSNFDVNLSGGGSLGGGGGGGGKGSEDHLGNMMSKMLGMDGAPSGSPNGYPSFPNMGGDGRGAASFQGAKDGIHDNGVNIFDIAKAKHNKALASGWLVGPAQVVNLVR